MPERLQKLLAAAGHGSRREIEGWIREGRVAVNGNPASLGDRAEPGDRITLDGEALVFGPTRPEQPRGIIYYKPEGRISTRRDPEGRPTVFQDLPALETGRWVAVGRLDVNSSGLMVFTDDGELADGLMHPSSRLMRRYAVRVDGELDAEQIHALTTGVSLEDGLARFERLEEGGGRGRNHWYRVGLREGRKREVRRLFESQGVKVNRLIRTAYGPVSLPQDMQPGEHRELSAEAMAQLEAAGQGRRPAGGRRPRATPHRRRRK